jgi:hypothetical protein
MQTKHPGALAIRLLMLVVLTTTLSSFSNPLGMDSYKVYLNDKLLFKQFIEEKPVQSISLNESAGTDQLTVYYDHCGRIGTGRTLSLLDGEQELKKWNFEDTESVSQSGMSCRISDIKAIQKPGKTIRVMYDSKELSNPIQVAAISPVGTNAKASR